MNWLAFDGRGLFFDGQIESGEAVSREAIDAGVYRGVELWPYPTETPSSTLLDFVMNHSAGTDFALRYARSALCGRVPVEPEMLDEIVHFLNDLNREFATGTEDYRWSGYADNCVHTLRNALAAASVWEPISVRVAKLLQIFHLAVPANEAINLAALGTAGGFRARCAPSGTATRVARSSAAGNSADRQSRPGPRRRDPSGERSCGTRDPS